MWRKVAVFLEMIKFSHTVFALPFALLAAAIAVKRNGEFRWLDLLGVVLCMVFARTAAMGFNRWADRRLDAANPRTRNRALPAGLLTPGQTLSIVALSALGFMASTALFVVSSGNRIPAALSVPVLLFLLGYSYSKRFTPFAHVWLGAALGMAPIAAWIAVRPTLEPTPWCLAAAVVLWVTGFDVIYACQDIDVDRKLGLRSIPGRFGFDRAMWIARACHAGMVGALAVFALQTPELGNFFRVAMVFVAGLLVVEHWLVRGRDLQRVNLAFLHVNGVISMGLFFVTLADLWSRG